MNGHLQAGPWRTPLHALKNASGRIGGYALARALTRSAPRMLMYHRFSLRPAWRKTDLATFEQHLRYLKQHYRIVTLDAMVDRYTAAGEFDPDEVVITVDDAYTDFHTLALPLLERLQVPVALYVPTDFVDGKEWLWPDRLLWLVQSSERDSVQWGDVSALPLGTLPQRRATWNTLADALLELDSVARSAAFAELEAQLGVKSPDRPTADHAPMTWDQVRDAAQRGVIIASQATAHVPMARESAERQRQLALQSKLRLESELGCRIRHFSYPHGRVTDFDRQSIDAVRSAGFESSAAAVPQRVADRHDRLFALPRLSPPSRIDDLRGKLSGLTYLREWIGGAPA